MTRQADATAERSLAPLALTGVVALTAAGFLLGVFGAGAELEGGAATFVYAGCSPA
jgi:hypothetical protein